MSDTAPGELELVRLFVNTVDLEDGDDELSSPDALAGWLEAHRLGGGSAGSADLHGARRLREAIRGLLLENSGMNVRKESALTLAQAAERARFAVRFDPAGTMTLEPARRGGGRSPRTARRDRRRCDGRRYLEPPQGLPGRPVRLGVLRPRPQPFAALVLDGGVR